MPGVQTVYLARKYLEEATQAHQATETQVDELRMQLASQMPGEASSVEALELQIAEATHTILTINQQVRLRILECCA
jgi:hypothetical protein